MTTTARKYFGTDGIRGRVGTLPILPDFVLKLGWAVGKVLARAGDSMVLIGKDTRNSNYMLESALAAGLSAAGVASRLTGPMPTPAIAYLTQAFRAQVGVVISASHNQFVDNGIKFFSNVGTKLPDEVELAIEAQMDLPLEVVATEKIGKVARVLDAPGRYIEFCKSSVPLGPHLAGMKLVVDCANGANYYVAPHVFRELGAQVIETGVSPNGRNINDHCGATDPRNLANIVLAEGADAGVAFDGDGDRVIMVDHKGEIVDGDELVYIIAMDRLSEGRLDKGVVGTQMSNLGLQIALESKGLEFARSQVGDRYVMGELKKRGWGFGGEASGHIICLKSTTTGDGIISGLQVLSAMSKTGKSLHELKQGMQKYPQLMINVPIAKPVKLQDYPDILAAVKKVESELGKRGRVLLRPSGTEAVVRVMVEGEDQKEVEQYAKHLAEVVQKAVG